MGKCFFKVKTLLLNPTPVRVYRLVKWLIPNNYTYLYYYNYYVSVWWRMNIVKVWEQGWTNSTKTRIMKYY